MATRGAVIYFVVAELANVDVMYQYSLTWFQSMFSSCIQESASISSVQGDNVSQSNASVGGSVYSTAREKPSAAPAVVEEDEEEEERQEQEDKEDEEVVEDSDENAGLFSPSSSHKFASGVLRPSSVKSIKSMRSNAALSTGGERSFSNPLTNMIFISFSYLEFFCLPMII